VNCSRISRRSARSRGPVFGVVRPGGQAGGGGRGWGRGCLARRADRRDQGRCFWQQDRKAQAEGGREEKFIRFPTGREFGPTRNAELLFGDGSLPSVRKVVQGASRAVRGIDAESVSPIFSHHDLLFAGRAQNLPLAIK